MQSTTIQRPVQPTPQGESLELRYARQTRNATVFIAWIVGVGVVISLIAGFIVGAQISHATTSIDDTSTSCDFSSPSWPDC